MNPTVCQRRSGPVATAAVVCALFLGPAQAIDWTVSGLVREEVALSLTGSDNELNQRGNVFNDRIVAHYTHGQWGSGANATALTSTYIDAAGHAGLFQRDAVAALTVAPRAGQTDIRTVPAGAFTFSPVNCRFGHLDAQRAGSSGLVGQGGMAGVLCPNGGGSAFVPGVNATVIGKRAAGRSARGAALDGDNPFNMFNTRAELDISASFNSSFAAFVKLRVYADGTSVFGDGHEGDLFGNPYWGRRSTLAEFNTRSAIIDMPSAYLDFHEGPLWMRLGNQTVAWGEAYFFRVMDVVNGLDLRRHLTLSPGGEEFKDQRVASPTLRVSYNFANDWELDSFASLFSPTVVPAQDSPYNLIASSTSLNESDEFNAARNTINFGVRLSMPFTEHFTLMAMYANRRNPDGVFRYAEAPIFNGGLANGFCVGAHNETNNLLKHYPGGALVAGGTVLPAGPLQGVMAAAGLDPMPSLLGGGHKTLDHCGAALAPDPFGPSSTEYWHLLASSHLDPMKALRTAVDEWPASQWSVRQVFGFGKERNVADALRTMESFHSLFGGFRAWVSREFKREQVFAVGANYITHSDDPSSFFDSIIVRGEVAVTPHKKFTDLGLSRHFIAENEIVSALIFEKFHRFSDAFPATYMVAQWMHRERSDLFGRHLSGTETVDFASFIDARTGDFKPEAFTADAAAPRGSSSANYVVFAFQQPSASLIWRFDVAMMVDVEGGYLVQPGIRYRPSDAWQWDLYANIIEGDGSNDSVMDSLDFADEAFARLSFFF